MTTGSKLGIVSLSLFATTVYMGVMDNNRITNSMASVVAITGFGLGILAGIHGNRWWFAVPVAMVLVFIVGLWIN